MLRDVPFCCFCASPLPVFQPHDGLGYQPVTVCLDVLKQPVLPAGLANRKGVDAQLHLHMGGIPSHVNAASAAVQESTF